MLMLGFVFMEAVVMLTQYFLLYQDIALVMLV